MYLFEALIPGSFYSFQRQVTNVHFLTSALLQNKPLGCPKMLDIVGKHIIGVVGEYSGFCTLVCYVFDFTRVQTSIPIQSIELNTQH